MNFIDPYGELAKVTYNGTKYDFRLEARWAVFMDAFSWKFEYIKSYDQPNEFVLRNVKIAIPHKNDVPTIIKNQDLSILVSEEPNEFIKLKARVMQRCNKNVFMVGSIPNGKTDKEVLSNLKFLMTTENLFSSTPHERTYHFYPAENIKAIAGGIEQQFSLWVDDDENPVMGHWHTRENRGDGNIAKTLEAFKQARQARFEHSQDGYSDFDSDDDDL